MLSYKDIILQPVAAIVCCGQKNSIIQYTECLSVTRGSSKLLEAIGHNDLYLIIPGGILYIWSLYVCNEAKGYAVGPKVIQVLCRP